MKGDRLPDADLDGGLIGENEDETGAHLEGWGK